MTGTSFDLIVIGGGPGGYVAAIRAAQLGMNAALIESEHLGGVCLNWGCIPTKALLHSAEVYHNMQHADGLGLKVKEIGFDFKKIVERSRGISKRLNAGVGHLLKKNKVSVFDGRGRLAGAGKVGIEKDGENVADLEAPHIVLATGARPRSLPGLEADGKLIWTYKEALVPGALPKSLLVVGSGAIGIEFASFFHTLGAEVAVVETLPRVLPFEDEEISARARKAFQARGMTIHTESTVKSLKKGKNSVTARIEAAVKSADIAVERVLVAAGVVGNVEDIGLEGTKVAVDKSHVLTDEWCRTGEPGVYAIGDLAGPPWLAHKASHEAVVCIGKIAGAADVHPLDASLIPACTYCRPQIASVGLTEAAAKEKGFDVKVGRFPYLGNGKAIAMGEAEGLVKTIFDGASGELLGAHMIGAEVTELIHGFTIARTMEATEAELMRTVFPHPTLSETMHESVLDAFQRAIHI
ncbi:MAG: dihydrolipoyl dehydrogenase [Rhodospirillales bacterium]|jgi:dihydrolipoamide dehydrogenase|nr:dihydrolipoyl dehydrogenase [Rhodospirillales bacterium]HIJ43222.1 dihydrolipoyl dehydrogenase [Rhodospirillaceae bacterium]HIJ45147.1 dihydrolipoyl dehydrogenase [Rhodospirillaceae bacterium]HJP53520.1 dihydrolipoyl dehydrogenase [Rhodospirillales bacterium]